MDAVVSGVYGAFYQIIPLENLKKTNLLKPYLLAKLSGKMRISKNNKLEALVPAIGDRVFYEITDKKNDEIDAHIQSIYERKNVFKRSSHTRVQYLGANIDSIIIILSLDNPPFNEGFLNRILTEAFLSKIKVLVILNKIDLLNQKKSKADEYNDIMDSLKYYQKIGYKVFKESLNNQVSPELSKCLKKGRYLTFGESGVGKSTFINTFLGEELKSTAEVGFGERGKHTTTNPTLHIYKSNIQIIDVPGIKEFGLSHRSKYEISQAFIEFQKYKCQFRDCLHIEEENCGVKAAVKKEKISNNRYRFYGNIISSLRETYKLRRGNLKK